MQSYDRVWASGVELTVYLVQPRQHSIRGGFHLLAVRGEQREVGMHTFSHLITQCGASLGLGRSHRSVRGCATPSAAHSTRSGRASRPGAVLACSPATLYCHQKGAGGARARALTPAHLSWKKRENRLPFPFAKEDSPRFEPMRDVIFHTHTQALLKFQ